MEARENAVLQLAGEVDEGVPADEQVDVRQRRRLRQVVGAEDAPAAELAPKSIELALAGEVTGHQALGQEDGDGVRLLAGRAARAPDPEAPRVCRVLHEPWDHVLRQHLPGLRVAEEAGHVDEDRVDERDVLAGVLVEQARIGRDRLRAHLGHARTDSPDERDFLVLAEVEVVLRAQLLEQLAEVFAELGRALTDRVVAVAHVSSPAGGATRPASPGPISSSGSVKSTHRVARAACGMPACAALEGSCTSVVPPLALMSRIPSAPSTPEPESTTAI